MVSSRVEPLRILVVDDDAGLLRTLGDILRFRGYDPLTAPSGSDGLSLAAQASPAIALVDLRLPDMDGLELASRLHDVSALTEVVVLTGNASLDSALRALREQSFDYLVKPVAPERLLETMERAGERWQRRAAESALREGEERLRRIFEHVSDALVIVDQDGRIVDANTAACALSGRTVEALSARTLASLIPGVTMPVAGAEETAPPAQHLLATADGRERHVDVRASAFAPGLFVYTIRDVTEQRELEEQFHQAQKMEAVGRLAGGIAHDFNNLLTAIKSYGQLLIEDIPADDEKRSDLDEIVRAADRAAGLTRQLLAFSRKQLRQLDIMDLNVVAGDLQRMLERIIGEDVRLVSRFAADLWHVRADRGQIEQAITNLVVNARDAMPQGGTLTIETANAVLDGDYARTHLEVRAGEYVRLSVSDTGHGMDRATMERIFEPFFTTKPIGKGTGLGLAMIYGVVKQGGGHIAVQSQPGRGTRFDLYLPRVMEAEVTPRATPRGTEPARGTETVLLVEDAYGVRGVAERILGRYGYRVLAASSGREALSLARQHGGPIHLLLTDMVMPDMNGEQVATRLRAMHPELRVLFMSGYTEQTVTIGGDLPEGIEFLEKPFSPTGLAFRVREVLDR